MPDRPKKVLLVTPHPDDAEGGCGGTVAQWIREGTEVVYVLCTNGDKGTGDTEMTPERLAAIREKEQMEAAQVLGVKRGGVPASPGWRLGGHPAVPRRGGARDTQAQARCGDVH